MLLMQMLREILTTEKKIFEVVRPRLSAVVKIGGAMPATILVGKTANSNWQEWSGPNGTGDKLPPAGPVTFQSSNPAVATVDSNSGLVTGVAVGTASISGMDSANSLTASDTVSVTEQAQSATLTLSAN